MRPEPGAEDLLLAAREALTAEVLPALQGGQRYAALMIANALGMAERELRLGPRLRAAELALVPPGAACGADELCRAIRTGRRDGDERLHGALYTLAIVGASITRPEVLTPEERLSSLQETSIREVMNGAGEASASMRLC
jgi:hypothetical protein